jgi:hypothetical protein
MRAEMTVLRCAMAADRFPTGHCRAAGPAGEAAPRPYTDMPGVPRRAFERGGWAQSPFRRGQAVPDPPAREGRQITTVAGRPWWCRCDGDRGIGDRRCRACGAAGEATPRPYKGCVASARSGACRHGWAVREPRAVGVRRCLTRRPVRAGNAVASVRMPITAGVRPGLKPRAESASPLKGAVRRPGARVDRLGAGAVGISRLQPAWGVSPAVHGRAIVDTAARLIGDACRARRVGHAESPRPWRGRARQRLAPRRVCQASPGGYSGATGGCHPRLVGVRWCLIH